MADRICSVPDCGKPLWSRGWCHPHYSRWWRHGDPLAGIQRGVPYAYFLAHVDDQTDACVLWPYGKTGAGYGDLLVDGKMRYAHVLSCEHHHGPMPQAKMDAAHGPCHNPACFNGRHLSWKTRKDNLADKVRDGTHLTGEQVPSARLTWAQVRAIRDRYAAGGISYAKLGAEYGVHFVTVADIVRGRRWRE